MMVNRILERGYNGTVLIIMLYTNVVFAIYITSVTSGPYARFIIIYYLSISTIGSTDTLHRPADAYTCNHNYPAFTEAC